MINIDKVRNAFDQEKKIKLYETIIEERLDEIIREASHKGLLSAHIGISDFGFSLSSEEIKCFSIALENIFEKYVAGGYKAYPDTISNSNYVAGWVSWKEE